MADTEYEVLYLKIGPRGPVSVVGILFSRPPWLLGRLLLLLLLTLRDADPPVGKPAARPPRGESRSGPWPAQAMRAETFPGTFGKQAYSWGAPVDQPS